jgi:NifU-like protein involved in Fe-S cluster formation
MAYSEKVLDHFKNPRNVGTFNKDAKNVGTGLVGAPECGDVMRLQIEVDEATGSSKTRSLKPSAAAPPSLLHRWPPSGSKAKASTKPCVKSTTWTSWKNWPCPPVKIHCSVLAEDAIKAAIADYQQKNAN